MDGQSTCSWLRACLDVSFFSRFLWTPCQGAWRITQLSTHISSSGVRRVLWLLLSWTPSFFLFCNNTWRRDGFQFYCSIMAIVSVTVKEWSVSTTRYNILVLLSVFGVYIYRDIWPLATFTKDPKDLQEGYLLWIKFSVITLTAVIIPLFIPRQYVPVDPKVRQCGWFCHFRRL